MKKRLMENSTSGKIWSSGKLFALRTTDTTIADRDASLTAEHLLFCKIPVEIIMHS